MKTLISILSILFFISLSTHAQDHSVSVEYDKSITSFRFWGKLRVSNSKLIQLNYNRRILKDIYLSMSFVKSIYFAHSIIVKRMNGNKTWEYPPFKIYNDMVGLLPLGLKYNKGFLFSKIQGGCVYFKDNFPMAEGNKFNFIFSVSSGVVQPIYKSFNLIASLKYNHISNGGITHLNIGSDQLLFNVNLEYTF